MIDSEKLSLQRYLENKGISAGRAYFMIHHPKQMSHDDLMTLLRFAIDEDHQSSSTKD